MKIRFEIEYRAIFGHSVCISGNIPELGNWQENNMLILDCRDEIYWSAEIEVKGNVLLEYYYVVKEGSRLIREEWGNKRSIFLNESDNFYLKDSWHDIPVQKYLYTSVFSESIFKHETYSLLSLRYYSHSVYISLICPYVGKNQQIILTGESDYLGDWKKDEAIHLTQYAYGQWICVLDADKIERPLAFKFAILDKETNQIIHWEEGDNRVLQPVKGQTGEIVYAYDLNYRHSFMNWKSAGVVIPVFSLRTEKSFGIGEFSDLRKMIDWAKATGMKFIQTLPINDTTNTHTWADSYPYNAISIYAIHPIYLGLSEFPLQDKNKQRRYRAKAKKLNALKEVDYEQALLLKESYLKDLFHERKEVVFSSDDFKHFYEENKEWLFPYACFTHLRDKYESADYSRWKTLQRYNEKTLKRSMQKDELFREDVELAFFTQYLLHCQLSEVKTYAHQNGIVLKGDVPIGINRHSVDAWMEPHLFNLDTQTGAPPDDFSVFGQNWGFPTYNWYELAKNGYEWWKKRFRKMADYFDAYRIDHILGFFRIWEIPLDSVQGLLGYFSPALPFTMEEIGRFGFNFDANRMTKPYIHIDYLHDLFGEDDTHVREKFLNPVTFEFFELKEFCNTQLKIKSFFQDKEDEKNARIREGLYTLCNEVLFVRDKREPSKYHPRITAQYTHSYKALDEQSKESFNRLYDNFFYERHNQFWRDQAMLKLPVLINATNMLVCGEDLGMIPESVPSVMNELQILALEIERMPKQFNVRFENLNNIPYLSVCTTSTHDMSPVRAWWLEDKRVTQMYYNEVLKREGEAPEQCSEELCKRIIQNHLNSPAMLAILPLQDWLSMNEKLRRDNPYEERINIPAVSQHYWSYRMHITLENLLESSEFNNEIRAMLKEAGRE